MDRAVFFNAIRKSLFKGRIRQEAVNNIDIILTYWEENFPDNPIEQLAYILATVRHEVAENMKPVRETFAKSDKIARRRLAHKAYGKSAGEYGHAYYGRGYVQLTWLSNYRAQSSKLGIDLVQFPDRALETEVALRILVNGMMAGDFNRYGHGLPFYVNENKVDFFEARRTVNILDKAALIKAYAEHFLDALELAVGSTHPMHSVDDSDQSSPYLNSEEHTARQTSFFGLRQ